jgi:hypothetical protein
MISPFVEGKIEAETGGRLLCVSLTASGSSFDRL